MTNLENYFGISVLLSSELEPMKLDSVMEKAVKLTKLVNFDINNFNVYLHTITIFKKRGHFSYYIPLSSIIEELNIRFQVNKKQVKAGQIKFFNYLISETLPKGIKEGYGDFELVRKFSGSFLDEHETLYTELITFIDKSLTRDSFKKIKIHIQGFPTSSYSNDYLSKTKKEEFITSFDIKYSTSIQLKIKFPSEKEQRETIQSIEIHEKLNKLATFLQESDKESSIKDLQYIEKAIEASKLPNNDKVVAKYLSMLGKKTLGIAKDIGINLLSNAISSS